MLITSARISHIPTSELGGSVECVSAAHLSVRGRCFRTWSAQSSSMWASMLQPRASRRRCGRWAVARPGSRTRTSGCFNAAFQGTARTTSCRRAPARQAALAARAAAAAAALPRPRRRGRAAARWTRRGGQCTPPSRLPPHAPPRCRRRGCGVREAPPAAGRLAGGRRGGGEARHGVRLPAAPPRTEKGGGRRRRRGEPGRESATAETAVAARRRC